MSEEHGDNRLHLPDLSITGFRGIASLTIKRLGRVTLIAERIVSAKRPSSMQFEYMRRVGNLACCPNYLRAARNWLSLSTMNPIGKREFCPTLRPCFTDGTCRGMPTSRSVPISNADQLRIEEAPDAKPIALREESFTGYFTRGYRQAFKVVFQGAEKLLPWFLPIEESAAARTVERHSAGAFLFSWDQLVGAEWQPPIGCQPLGPGVLSNEEIVRFWNAIALTDDEDRAIQALRLVFGSDLERVAVMREDEPIDKRHVERVLAKLRGQARPVPFQSLGDGALHLAGTAMALANSRNGFLLIDEAENGIHHTVQRDFWRMVLKTADENNVQVFATTHSYDCVRGFAQAVTECDGIDGALVRLERKDNEMWAVEYSERDLKVVGKQHIEVR